MRMYYYSHNLDNQISNLIHPFHRKEVNHAACP